MASRRGIVKFLAKFIESGSVARKLGSGRLSKATAEVRNIIEEAMRTDNNDGESLPREFCVSLSTVLRVMLISTYARKREKAVQAVLTFAWNIPWNGTDHFTSFFGKR